jgi:cell division protein FtsB
MPQSKKTIAQRIFSFRYLIVINLLIIALLSVSLGREVIRNHGIQSEINLLQVQAEELAVDNIEISELYTAIQTESYIEREARLKLGMKKPGERVVVVQDTEQGVIKTEEVEVENFKTELYSLSTSVPTKELANVYKWWYYFFDKEQING